MQFYSFLNPFDPCHERWWPIRSKSWIRGMRDGSRSASNECKTVTNVKNLEPKIKKLFT
jgi:hypothetical protein